MTILLGRPGRALVIIDPLHESSGWKIYGQCSVMARAQLTRENQSQVGQLKIRANEKHAMDVYNTGVVPYPPKPRQASSFYTCFRGYTVQSYQNL